MTEELKEDAKSLTQRFEQLLKLTKALKDEDYHKLMSKIEIFKSMYSKNRSKGKLAKEVKTAKKNKPTKKTDKKENGLMTFKKYLDYLDF